MRRRLSWLLRLGLIWWSRRRSLRLGLLSQRINSRKHEYRQQCEFHGKVLHLGRSPNTSSDSQSPIFVVLEHHENLKRLLVNDWETLINRPHVQLSPKVSYF